jgi:TonB family protein
MLEHTRPVGESEKQRSAAGSYRRFVPDLARELLARVRNSRALASRSAAYVVPSACAVALNIATIVLFLIGLRLPDSDSARELHLILSPILQAELRPEISIPNVDMPSLQMPEIVIAPDAPAPAATASSAVLAPRADPAHPNPSFTEAGNRQVAPTSESIVLRILVLPDGSVADASVAKTSGQHDIDVEAIVFVKAQWKFLPAVLDGKPIRYWTTVAVRLT